VAEDGCRVQQARRRTVNERMMHLKCWNNADNTRLSTVPAQKPFGGEIYIYLTYLSILARQQLKVSHTVYTGRLIDDNISRMECEPFSTEWSLFVVV